MRRIYLLLLLLLCCCSFSSLRTINYKNYAVAYYENLTDNFPYNYRGSCGYVSMCMLLSYYDSYLSDDVVHEFFDVNSASDGSYVPGVNGSPGVRQDFLVNGDSCTNQEYLDMIERNKQTSLHSYLLSEGIRLGACHTGLDNKINFGLMCDEEISLLNIYLSNKTPFSTTTNEVEIRCYNTINCGSEQATRDAIISSIKAQRPIMLSLSGTSNHSVIAYDYDEENDIIYCHPGYHGYNTRLDINEIGLGNVTIRYGIDLIFMNQTHQHNDNYILFSDGNSDYYCSCSSAIGFNYLFS